MKGKKPLPSALKKLRGTDQPIRMNQNEAHAQLVSKMPPPPSWFSKIGKQIYRSKSTELIAQGVMSTLDIDMFVLYCHEYAIYLETSEMIATLKITIAEIYAKAKADIKQASETHKKLKDFNQAKKLIQVEMAMDIEDSQYKYSMALKENQRAWERAKSIAIEFGFTPSSRSRVSTVAKKEEMSEFEKMIKGF